MSPQITTLGTIGNDAYYSMRSRLKTSGIYRPEDNALMQNYRYEIDCYDESPYEIEVQNGFSLSTQISISLSVSNSKLYLLHFSVDGRFLYFSYRNTTSTQTIFGYVRLQLTVPWYFTENESTNLSLPGFSITFSGISNPTLIPGGITSSLDGFNFYTIDNNTGSTPRQIYVRRHSIISGRENNVWDFQTTNYSNTQIVNIVNFTNSAKGIKIHPDGTKLYIMKGDFNFTNGSGVTTTGYPAILQFSLSTPWSLSSIAYDGQLRLDSYETSPTDMEFSSDGSILYFTGLTTKRIHQVTLNTPWNVVSGINSQIPSKFLYRGYYTGHDSEPSGLYFNRDGLFFYILGSKYLTPPLLSTDTATTSIGSITRYGLIIT